MSHNIDFTKTLLYVEGEKNEKLKAGRKMLKQGYTIFQVQDVTELTFEQIQTLQDEINNNNPK